MLAVLFLSSVLTSIVSADIISHVVRETPEEVLAYWTPERRAAAIPVPPPEKFFADFSEMEVGETGFSKSFDPFVVDENGDGWNRNKSSSPDLLGAPTPVANPNSWPYQVVGKVFFTLNGQSYVCSASSIQRNTVLTAGHCVWGTNWATYFAFYPAYPYRTGVAATRLYGQTGYQTNPVNYAYDVGMATFGTSAHFDTLGWSGTYWNYGVSTSTQWRALGYPQAPPYSGGQMYEVYGNAIIPQYPATYPGTVEMPSGLTGGASGGPWWNQNLISIDIYANGVNSFIYTSVPNNMYSPYFATWFGNMFSAVTAQQFT